MSVREALLDALRVVVETGDGEGVPNLARYAVLYPSPGRRSAEDVAGTYDLLEYRFTVVNVGSTPQQAEWVATRTADTLTGRRLTVPGLACGPIEAYEPTQIVRDEDNPDATVFYTSAAYRLLASRA